MTDKQEQQPQPPADPDEGFLQRWSRRKLATEPAPVQESALPEPAPDVPAATEPEPPGDADMPALDSLGPNSDVSGFFSPRVSEELRQAALKRLFHQPEFNITDGLDDYCEDYRNFKPLGEVVTADMRHRLQIIQERLERLTGNTAETVVADNAGTGAAAGNEELGNNEESDGHA